MCLRIFTEQRFDYGLICFTKKLQSAFMFIDCTFLDLAAILNIENLLTTTATTTTEVLLASLVIYSS